MMRSSKRNWIYALHGNGAQSTLVVEMDTTEEHEQFFHDTWPKALASLKQLAEL
jgi:hypothetical protein